MMRIDGHLHLNNNLSIDEELAHTRRELSEAGMDKAFLIPNFPRTNNSELLYAIRKYPEQFYGVFTLNLEDQTSLLDDFNRLVSSGFRGLKLHPRFQNLNLKENTFKEVLSLCNSRDIPVIIDGFLSDKEDSLFHLELIRNITTLLTATRVVIAHSGGYRFSQILSLAGKKDNIYMDISFSLMYFGDSPISKQLCSAIREFGPGRFLYGSDYPEFGIKESASRVESVLRQAGLDDGQISDIFSNTALKVFPDNEQN